MMRIITTFIMMKIMIMMTKMMIIVIMIIKIRIIIRTTKLMRINNDTINNKDNDKDNYD